MTLGHIANKQFKSDSARVAFLVCVGFSDYGGMRRHRYCVPHTLIGRYNYFLKSSMKEEIEKTTILMAQLNKACSLHNSREYYASITLAGSADSLSEELLASRDKKSYNSFFESVIRKIAEIRGDNSPSRRDILRGKNWVRNSFKHHSKGDPETIKIDLKHQSLIIIMSALENYSRLGFKETPVMTRFVKKNR